jgi:hypothetical protein
MAWLLAPDSARMKFDRRWERAEWAKCIAPAMSDSGAMWR